MKYSARYKFVATFSLVFVLAISLMFTFLVGKESIIVTDSSSVKHVNYAYFIFKDLALIYLLVAIALIWKKDATFAKYFPFTMTAVIFQLVPALGRIGFKTNYVVGTWVYFLFVILIFFFLGSSLLYLVSNDQFHEEEQKAKHSSNHATSTRK